MHMNKLNRCEYNFMETKQKMYKMWINICIVTPIVTLKLVT